MVEDGSGGEFIDFLFLHPTKTYELILYTLLEAEVGHWTSLQKYTRYHNIFLESKFTFYTTHSPDGLKKKKKISVDKIDK